MAKALTGDAHPVDYLADEANCQILTYYSKRALAIILLQWDRTTLKQGRRYYSKKKKGRKDNLF